MYAVTWRVAVPAWQPARDCRTRDRAQDPPSGAARGCRCKNTFMMSLKISQAPPTLLRSPIERRSLVKSQTNRARVCIASERKLLVNICIHHRPLRILCRSLAFHHANPKPQSTMQRPRFVYSSLAERLASGLRALQIKSKMLAEIEAAEAEAAATTS